MIIQLCAAVGAVEKPGQGIGLADGIVAAGRLSQLLGKLPGFFIHDSLVGVFKNQPVLRSVDNSPLVLVGFLVSAEVDRMPHILRLGEDLPHREAIPAIRPGNVLSAFPNAPALSGEIDGGCFDFFLTEHRGNFIGAVALNGKLKNTPHNSRRFLVDQPVVFVVGVFPVAVDGAVGGGLARLTLDPDGSSLLAAQIPQIPFRHDVDERRKLTGIGAGAVDAVADGDETHSKFSEKDLCVLLLRIQIPVVNQSYR